MGKVIAIIPARYQSSRFPGKPLALIKGKPMIRWVYEKVICIGEIDYTYVATDDKRIKDCVDGFGGKCLMTSLEHNSGTDRLAECVDILHLTSDDIVLNIQGDEPLIQKPMVLRLISTMDDVEAVMGTLKEKIVGESELNSTDVVKVVTDKNDYALYFSRLPIPFKRNGGEETIYYRHVGVYAYRVDFLRKYANLEKSKLEDMENLEQLRVLENGYKIKVLDTESVSIGVDTPEQLQIVEKLMEGDY